MITVNKQLHPYLVHGTVLLKVTVPEYKNRNRQRLCHPLSKISTWFIPLVIVVYSACLWVSNSVIQDRFLIFLQINLKCVLITTGVLLLHL